MWSCTQQLEAGRRKGFQTRAIHAGQDPDPATGAVAVPIYQTSTYKQDGVGGLRGGYEYSRSANPTRTALEQCLAALEGGTHGLAFASGLAAETALLVALCSPGDHVVIPNDAYGGTFRLFARVLERWGLDFTPAWLGDLDQVRAAIRPQTRLIWCETHLRHAEPAAAAGVGGRRRRALDHQVHRRALRRRRGGARGHRPGAGRGRAVPPELTRRRTRPVRSWLVLRGAKTLGVRMDRHCANAERIVEVLAQHPSVGRVLYPGLPDSPGYEVATKQMSGYGGMASFTLRGGEQQALRVCERTELFTLGESLGGVESLIEHPGRMTHASAAGSPLEVAADLVRLSGGIETAEDLVDDLRQALDCADLRPPVRADPTGATRDARARPRGPDRRERPRPTRSDRVDQVRPGQPARPGHAASGPGGATAARPRRAA